MEMEREQKTNEAMELGNDFELPILNWAARELGVEIQTEALEYQKGIFLVHPDAMIVGRNEHMEAKLTGTRGYGETTLAEPTAEVPADVVIQGHTQMYACETEVTWVPVLMPGYIGLTRKLYKVDREEKLIDELVARSHAWWQEHVVEGKEPEDGALLSSEILKCIRRRPGVSVQVGAEIFGEYQSAQAQAGVAKRALNVAKDKLIVALGDGEIARAEGFDKEVTYFTRKGRTTFGTGAKYEHKCDSCGVGSKQGQDYRQIGQRGRTDEDGD